MGKDGAWSREKVTRPSAKISAGLAQTDADSREVGKSNRKLLCSPEEAFNLIGTGQYEKRGREANLVPPLDLPLVRDVSGCGEGRNLKERTRDWGKRGPSRLGFSI